MEVKNKFTFKTEKPTGKFRSFSNSQHYIKIKKNIIGKINENVRGTFANGKITIGFMVIKDGIIIKDNNNNCSWKWVFLKREFQSVQEAKDWLNSENNFNNLNKQFNFYIEK